MTLAASGVPDRALLDLNSHPGSGRAPMFGHRAVGWGRHAGAVFAAALVSTTAQVAIAISTVFIAMRMTGGTLGPHPVAVVGVTALALWITIFVVVSAELAIGFTVARAALTLSRRNFGAAYLAIGLVIGTVEASVLGAFKGGAAPRDFVFSAATGVLAGFVYWLVASRDRDAMTREACARSATAFR